jgi:xylan 1,4-beta-xylosidase
MQAPSPEGAKMQDIGEFWGIDKGGVFFGNAKLSNRHCVVMLNNEPKYKSATPMKPNSSFVARPIIVFLTRKSMMMKFALLIIAIFISTGVFSQQLVLPGDHPDPSVVKIGDTYWASATTSNWAPVYPLLQSKDLLHWTTTGHIFDTLPSWADYYFWAPEITFDSGKVYVYYAAHKKGGNLCVAVASADKPEGPYTDHGPLICEAVGSIDAFPMRDENGKLYIIWKEDANSVGKPTSIWAMQMNEARTTLSGERIELFRNDTAIWEKNLVEGVAMIKNNGYFYAFYAGAGCCGIACTYGVGIARSKSLLGPWEKYAKNPVLTANDRWSCPGHGTPVEKDGRHFFMYHAYDKKNNVYTGREGLLMEYVFTKDDWISFKQDSIVSDNTLLTKPITDEFDGDNLSLDWQWSVFQKPIYSLGKGSLSLQGTPGGAGSFLGQKTLSGNYIVNVTINTAASTSAAGVAAIGDEKNIIYAAYKNGQVNVIQVKDGKDTMIASRKIPAQPAITLRMHVANGKDIRFFYSVNGNVFSSLHKNLINGAFLPPWDRAVRAGILSKGAANTKAVFDQFEMGNNY